MTVGIITGASFSFRRLTLLCGIVLVGLTLPLPYVTVNIIKIIGGDVANAVEVEEVGLCGQRADHGQHPPHRHLGARRDWTPRPGSGPRFI